MKKTKEPMSLAKYMLWSNIVVGVLRVAFAVIGCIPVEPLYTFASTLLFVSSIIELSLLKRNTDIMDELALQNLNNAKSRAGDITSLALTIFVFFGIALYSYFSLSNAVVNPEYEWLRLLILIPYFFFGIKNIATGVIFRKLEEE